MVTEHEKQVFRWRLIVASTFILVLLTCVGATIYEVFGPPAGFRERVFPVMRQEIAQLPAFPGSSTVDEGEYNGPFHKPDLEADYTLVGSCADVEDYYTHIAADHGWVVTQSTGEHGSELTTVLHKDASGFHLRLDVECFSDRTASHTYTLFMRAS